MMSRGERRAADRAAAKAERRAQRSSNHLPGERATQGCVAVEGPSAKPTITDAGAMCGGEAHAVVRATYDTQRRDVAAIPRPVIASATPVPTAVRAYVEVAAEMFPSRFSPARCLNVSRIFVEVMHRFGLAGARALSVHVMAQNSAYRSWESAQTDDERRGWEARGAWAVSIDGVAPDASHVGWAGHVVGVVDDCLVDGATGQMSRPARDLVLPEVLVVNATTRFLQGEEPAGATSSGGSRIIYRARLEDRQFERLPGFQKHKGNLRVIDEVERRMRGLLT